jgi:hypothetical protein
MQQPATVANRSDMEVRHHPEGIVVYSLSELYRDEERACIIG